jgi:DNA modification methylase
MAKKRSQSDSPKLFNEQVVPAEPGSGKLFDVEYIARDQPVTCLGMTFKDDGERRSHFTEELRKKLKDPEFRKIEGFPTGEDEDILRLSDPPYHTACPNPWLADFVAEWGSQNPPKPPGWTYHCEPFAADVGEGKYDPLYKMHPYPTKVPHRAIMRYILRYTEPGDIVFDGFCGTGMTGVAATLCGDKAVVESLGFRVTPDKTVLQEIEDHEGKKTWVPFSRLGARRALLNDLSPSAAFISYNYNTPIIEKAFEKEATSILDAVEKECDWMNATKHSDGRVGTINYTVWSDVFTCPECTTEVVFWEVAVDKDAGKVNDAFKCLHCGSNLTKRTLERVWLTRFDPNLKASVRQAKQVPVRISYSVSNKRFEKVPDQDDLRIIEKCESLTIPYWLPITQLPEGFNTSQPIRSHGLTSIHHFYTARNLYALALFNASCNSLQILSILTKVSGQITKRYRFTYQSGVWGAGGGPQSGTLYVPSLVKELNIVDQMRSAIRDRSRAGSVNSSVRNVTSVSSTTSFGAGLKNCLDYIFIDPPFGSNIMYSELALLWEEWLRIKTDNATEAIENSAQKKGPEEYRKLMTSAFKRAYDLLKPGRWMTVEFSNTQASVWNNIQTAMAEAGFIVANVSALDKQKGSFKAVTTPTAVKQDLVISAYKPNGGFEERFTKEAFTEEGVWDFVRTHLKYLPVTKPQGELLQFVPERDPRILFDQMVAYYVRKGYPVPLSSPEFQSGLGQRFIERDGMYFLTDQIAEYDRKKALSGKMITVNMFVSDESTAIQWLRHFIKEKPQTFSDINTPFMKQLGGWNKNEAQLDLRELLNQNFLCYEGKGPVPEQIHAYLSTNWKEMRNLAKDDPQLIAKAKDRWYVPDPNKAGDLEKLREKALLKEFEEYKESRKKLKVFRLEAVRAGFKKLWQERTTEAYRTIVEVAEKIPNSVLEEDPKLLMWYDQAVTRLGEGV